MKQKSSMRSTLLRATFMTLTALTTLADGGWSVAYGQQIPKKKILVEKWSGTWCQPCTGAARALETMDGENAAIAVISYQYEKTDAQIEKYQTIDGPARGRYYDPECGPGGASSFPTTRLDGVSLYKGGNATGTIYPKLMPLYEARKALKTSFDLSLSSLQKNDAAFTVGIRVNKVAEYAGTNLKLRVAVTEKAIPEEWKGMTALHYVHRVMLPDTNGTAVLTSGTEQVVTLTGALNAAWNKEELELVCFLQDDDTKEVLQTISVPLYRTSVLRKGSKTSGFSDIEYYWYMATPYTEGDSLKAYRVYDADGSLLSELSPTEDTYRRAWPQAGLSEVKVAAVYDKAGEGALSEPINGKTYRRNLGVTPLDFRYDEANARFVWQAGTAAIAGDSLQAYSAHQPLANAADGSLDVDRKGGALMENVWAVYRWEPEEAEPFRGLEIREVSFLPGAPEAGYTVGVFEDGRLIYSASISSKVLQKDQWYTHTLEYPVFVSGQSRIEVGYQIRDLSTMPLSIDKGPVLAAGKSNLIGVPQGESVNWEPLYEGNNLIRVGLGIPAAQGDGPETYAFKGYNLYRDGQLVNASPMAETLYAAAQPQDGIYYVTACYGDFDSEASNSITLGTVGNDGVLSKAAEPFVRLYPNPTQRTVYFQGDYQSCEVFDLTGKKVFATATPVSELQLPKPGLYFFRIGNAAREIALVKVVVK